MTGKIYLLIQADLNVKVSQDDSLLKIKREFEFGKKRDNKLISLS